MPTDETPLERNRRIIDELLAYPLGRPDMGAEEMIDAFTCILKNYEPWHVVLLASLAMRLAVERTWDLRAAMHRD